jgi:hypothetical protein
MRRRVLRPSGNADRGSRGEGDRQEPQPGRRMPGDLEQPLAEEEHHSGVPADPRKYRRCALFPVPEPSVRAAPETADTQLW